MADLPNVETCKVVNEQQGAQRPRQDENLPFCSYRRSGYICLHLRAGGQWRCSLPVGRCCWQRATGGAQ